MRYHIGYIARYMIDYDCGVPMSVIIGIALIVFATIIITYHHSTDDQHFLRNTSWCIFGGYVSFIFCATVLFRDQAEEIRYSLQPFLTYANLYNRRIAEVVLNVLMFIPIGFLSGIAFKNAESIKVIGLGCLLSLSIEILQLLTLRGVCNIDDVIHNTLGCAIGYGIYRLCESILKHKHIILASRW